jgi:hypothetical protein
MQHFSLFNGEREAKDFRTIYSQEGGIVNEFISIGTFKDKKPWLTSVIPACPESFLQLTSAKLY